MRNIKTQFSNKNPIKKSTRFYSPACLWLLLILACCCVLHSKPCQALTAGAKHPVEKIEVRGLYSIKEKEFLEIFGVAENSEIDRGTVRNGIKRVFLTGLFEDISVEVSEPACPVGRDEKTAVQINVREKEIINKIYINGNYGLSEKDIRKLFRFKEEQIMRYDLMQTAVNELAESLLLCGFPDSKIDIKIEKAAKPYKANIYLDVDTGEPLIIRNIKISNSDKDVLNEMKLSNGSTYNQYVLKDDLKRIKEFYKQRGYFNPAAGPYSYKDGELEITVKPGKHIIVKIEGNSAISEKSLLKEVPFFENEMFNDESVEEAVFRMLSIYHREGYPVAQIAPVIKYVDESIDISFFVFEGPIVKISGIKFNGAKLPHKELKNVMLLKENKIHNPDFIERDRTSLKEFYGALGYLEADIKQVEANIDENSNTAEINITIDEGEKTQIVLLDITGVDKNLKSKLQVLAGIKEGDPYNEVDISDARFRILDYYSNSGYPGIDVIVSRSIENHRASVIFDVVEGIKKQVGTTIIAGNRKTEYKVIKRELRYTEGQPYTYRMLADERQRLFKLGLFTDVEVESVDDGEDKKDILIRVKEGAAGSVEFGFGYAEYEQFRGFVELSYRNLWGMNRQSTLSAELSSLERRYILQYHEPWFMGIPLPFRMYFLYEDKEEINIEDHSTRYRMKRYGITAGVEKKLSDKIKAELYYDFSFVRTFDVQPDVVLSKEDVGKLAISSIKPSIIYDSRDSPFEPRKGILAGISLKTASFLLFSESDFVKLEAFGSAFHGLTRRITFGISVKGGAAYGFRDTVELPIVERFFLGGRSTVRGYNQDTLGPKGSDGNPTGGNAFLMANIELRTSITRNVGIVTFFDMGNVWIKINDIRPVDLKYTTGIGLRYNTPVGPISIDYGVKLNRNRGENTGALHFSIGHAF